jgi:hypothetical protein
LESGQSFRQLTGAIRFGSADSGKVIDVVKRPIQISMVPLIDIQPVARSSPVDARSEGPRHAMSSYLFGYNIEHPAVDCMGCIGGEGGKRDRR